jgi:ComF family protein
MVNKTARALLDGLFRQHCALCGLASRRHLPLCRDCNSELPVNDNCCYRCAIALPPDAAQVRLCGQCLLRPPPFDHVRAPWLYGEYLAALIQRWKFRRDHHLTALLATLWLSRAGPLDPVDALVPVPLHWRRLFQRGFNQSELLCRHWHANVPALADAALLPRAVCRRRATPAQSSLGARGRKRNLESAFTANVRCDNLRIALVDDVMTTGATAAAVAACLRAAGAAHIEVWCLARTATPY